MSQLHEFQKKIRHITTYKLQKTEKFNRFRKLKGYKSRLFKGIKKQNGKKKQLI